MRVSRYFLPLIKENPSEAQIASHRLMLRAGMVRQVTSGIYTWLPLGLNVLKKVEQVVREEMNAAGAVEIMMPIVQPAELWIESGRYDAYGKEMLRFKDRHERDMLFGPTHEEVITTLFKDGAKSYRDVPQNLYQIHWKFRDEIRPRFGVMRSREFLMKDAYSFDIDYDGAKRSYDNYYAAYLRTFARLGLVAIPVSADTGAIGGNLSHEFQVMAETGESQVYYDQTFDDIRDGKATLGLEAMQQLYAAADEKHDPATCPIPPERLRSARGIEVGHIFYFGTKYSKALGANVVNKSGETVAVEMGAYGIGVSRVVGALIEAHHDENGIVWPEEIAPFHVGLINLKASDAECTQHADAVYEKLTALGVETLYHDTDDSAGSKFAAFDLIGLPWQLTVGPRGVKAGTVELKNRRSGEKHELSLEDALKKLMPVKR